jgi:hypothetical protein
MQVDKTAIQTLNRSDCATKEVPFAVVLVQHHLLKSRASLRLISKGREANCEKKGSNRQFV